MNQPLNTVRFTTQVRQWVSKPQNTLLIRNVVVVLLLLWICFTLARVFWVLMPSPTLPEVSTVTPRNAVLETKPSAKLNVDVEPLLTAELFGTLDTTAPEPEEVEQPQEQYTVAGETSLNLTLRGVIKSSIAENSEAIIAHGREEHVYRIGDKLPVGNRVKLVQVESKRVILDNSGRKEALSLFDDTDGGNRNSSRSASSGRSVSTARSRASSDDERPSSRVSTPAHNNDGAEPERSTLKQMPKSLADVIKFSIARQDGDIVGYKIRPGRNRDAFNSLGLKANDIVTDINGIALTDSGSITQVYREMRTATSAAVTLLRDGQSLQLNVDLASQQ